LALRKFALTISAEETRERLGGSDSREVTGQRLVKKHQLLKAGGLTDFSPKLTGKENGKGIRGLRTKKGRMQKQRIMW